MIKEAILAFIILNAPKHGINPDLAIAVAEHESGFKSSATSHKGAIGIFQIVPRYHPEYTEKQLRDPKINIIAGLKILKKFKESCIHQDGLTFLTCYNAGPSNARKIKHPHRFPYVIAVKGILKRMEQERDFFFSNKAIACK